MIEVYKDNEVMRRAHFRMNGITHAEIWDTDNGYCVALCGGDGQGWPEGHNFSTPGECVDWVETYAPELPIKE